MGPDPVPGDHRDGCAQTPVSDKWDLPGPVRLEVAPFSPRLSRPGAIGRLSVRIAAPPHRVGEQADTRKAN